MTFRVFFWNILSLCDYYVILDFGNHSSTATVYKIHFKINQFYILVLFAGVTGIMAGANVSGDLKNPSTSIPFGTFTGCGISFVVYTVMFFFTAMTTDKALLKRDCLYMIEIGIGSSGGYIIMIGALLVTLCACLNCLIGMYM